MGMEFPKIAEEADRLLPRQHSEQEVFYEFPKKPDPAFCLLGLLALEKLELDRVGETRIRRGASALDA